MPRITKCLPVGRAHSFRKRMPLSLSLILAPVVFGYSLTATACGTLRVAGLPWAPVEVGGTLPWPPRVGVSFASARVSGRGVGASGTWGVGGGGGERGDSAGPRPPARRRPKLRRRNTG